MPTSFGKAPIKEIIAELRWGVGSIPIELPLNQPVPLPVSFLADASHERFFMGLGEELSKIGYGRSERLTPVGFPTLPNQPVYRYQSNSDSSKSVLFQAGPGQFSVHGVPPYKSWEEFSPTVKRGLEAMFRAYSQTVGEQPVSLVTLRYVDFFEENLTRGLDVSDFMSEVLSISLRLPNFVTGIATKDRIDNLLVKFSLPVAAGTLSVTVGDGKLNNLSGIILDTSVATSGAIAPSVDKMVDVLNASYSILHKLFVSLTKPIEHLMEPKGAVTA
jgi:uncharacterized protein (TIGR04255 family)